MARGMVRDLLERLGPGESQPSLRVLDGPQTGVMLTVGDVGRTYILGRAAGNDLRLDDVDMWREHAALERDELGVTVRSAGTHAVSVNGERVTGARLLHDGDTVTLGATAMRYHDPAEVYLRKLEEEQPSEPPQVSQPIVVARRPELALVIVGILAALVAVGGILYVLLW
jgi:pSer/pThr/pTyr-binding forkhead associated (FHA) protein